MSIGNYEFEENKGVSGVLFPDGSFKKCGNAQHHYLLEDIPFEKQLECLYFSSPMISSGDGLITHSKIQFKGVTKEQLTWMGENFKFLDRGQKRRAWIDWDVEDAEKVDEVK